MSQSIPQQSHMHVHTIVTASALARTLTRARHAFSMYHATLVALVVCVLSAAFGVHLVLLAQAVLMRLWIWQLGQPSSDAYRVIEHATLAAALLAAVALPRLGLLLCITLPSTLVVHCRHRASLDHQLLAIEMNKLQSMRRSHQDN